MQSTNAPDSSVTNYFGSLQNIDLLLLISHVYWQCALRLLPEMQLMSQLGPRLHAMTIK